MQEVLAQKFARHLKDHHPYLEAELQQKGEMAFYVADRISEIDPLLSELLWADTPAYLIEAICMERLIVGLPPSPTDFIHKVLLNEFENEYEVFDKAGILHYEVLNMAAHCSSLFEALDFNRDNEDDKAIYCAITGAVKTYLDNNK